MEWNATNHLIISLSSRLFFSVCYPFVFVFPVCFVYIKYIFCVFVVICGLGWTECQSLQMNKAGSILS